MEIANPGGVTVARFEESGYITQHTMPIYTILLTLLGEN